MPLAFPAKLRRRAPLVAIAAIGLSLLLWRGITPAAPAQPPAPPACTDARFEAAIFTTCRLDPATQRLRLALTDARDQPIRTFNRLAPAIGISANDIAFAMNGGMYDEARRPIGLYVENGATRAPLNRRRASGNFYLQPNGVFWLDATGGHVATTAAYAAAPPPGVLQATQSGPMLVTAGAINPAFSPDGESRNIRNGVGVTRDGRTVFVISRDPVSFGKFARLLRDGLRCRDALYLDGTVSALWNPAAGLSLQRYELGPMIVVTRKPAI